MKRFGELNPEQQERAIQKARNELLREIVEGETCPSTIGEEMQKVYDEAVDEMERLQTPWFLAEALMENEAFRTAIETVGKHDANTENAFYPEIGDTVIYIEM